MGVVDWIILLLSLLASFTYPALIAAEIPFFADLASKYNRGLIITLPLLKT